MKPHIKIQNLKSEILNPKNRILGGKFGFIGVVSPWLVLAIYFLIHSSFVQAATGIYRTINFQGKIVNKSDATNITNNSYSFTFKLYDDPSAGNQLPVGSPWSETQSLTVTDGIFRATLGSSTPFPSTLNFNSDLLYLDITFNGEHFGSRVRLTAVPYAFNAEKVSGLTVTNTTGTLTIPNGTTIEFSGANNLTFVTSGTTTATLPSGTITLADTTTSQVLTNKTIGSTGLVFNGATTDISTVSNEHLAIIPNGTGNVGIGTTLPGAKLEVSGDIWLGKETDRVIKVAPNSTGNGGNLTIEAGTGNQGGSGTGGHLYLNAGDAGDAAAGNVYIAVGTGGYSPGQMYLSGSTIHFSASNALTEKMTLSSEGNLGIGTTSPIAKLDVAFTDYISTNVYGVKSGVIGSQGEDYAENVYGMYSSITGGGNVYGLYVGNISSSVGYPNEYGVYVSDSTASNYFAGNVGIGSTSPLEKLDVSGNATISGNLTIAQGSTIRPAYGPLSLAYKSGLNAWSTGLILQDTTGYVGIGTTSPNARLYVAGNTTISNGTFTVIDTNYGSLGTAKQLITSNDTWGTSLNLINTSAGGTTHRFMTYGSTNPYMAAGSFALLDVSDNHLLVADTSQRIGIGTVSPTAKLDVSGTASVSALTIRGSSPGYVDQINGNDLRFRTSVGGDIGLTDRMILTNTGNIGIGTTQPLSIFHVLGTAQSTSLITTTQTISATPLSSLDIKYNTNTNLGRIGAVTVNSTDTFYLFATASKQIGLGANSNMTPHLLINTDGNIGIGTTSPTASLDVSGMATISANLTMGGQVQVGRFGAEPTQVGVGSMYYNTSTNKFRCYTTSWVDCDTTGGGSLPSGTEGQMLYNNGGTWTASSRLMFDDTNFLLNITSLGDVGGYIGNSQALSTNEFGIYESSGDQPIAVWDADNSLARFGPSGAISVNTSSNVGIGTTLPLEKLDVLGSATLSGNLTIGQTGVLRSQYGPLNLAYKSGLNTWSAAMTIQDGTGYVGIGTTHPGVPLTVISGTNSAISGATGGVGKVGVYGTSGTVAGYGVMGFNNSATGVSILAQQDSTGYALYSLGGRNYFSGNVGIGSTSPSNIVDIIGSAGANMTGQLRIMDTASAVTGTGGGITFAGYYNGTSLIIDNAGGIKSAKTNNTQGNYSFDLSFLTREHGSSPSEKMRITDSGNVGIGTTNPLFKLDVSGMATVSANLTMGGQMQVGRFGAEPTQVGVGSMYYNTSTNKFRCYQNASWTDCIGTGSPGSSVWSDLTDPEKDLGINMSSWRTTFTYGTSTSTNNLFTLTDGISNTGTGYLLNVITSVDSSVKPFHVSSAGTEAILVNELGNVGIGNLSPLEKLDIVGGASMSANLTIGQTGVLRSQYGPLNLAYKSGLDTWTTGVTLKDISGNVGIGTTNPQAQLHLNYATTADPAIQFSSDGNQITLGIDSSDNDYFKISDSTALGTTDRFVMNADGRILLTGGTAGGITFITDDNTGFHNPSSDQINFYANGQNALVVDGTSGQGELGVFVTPDATLDVVAANSYSSNMFELERSSGGVAGGQKYLTVTNNGLWTLTPYNTGSTVPFKLQVDSTGDSSILFDTDGSQFTIGVDSSDSDKFKISNNNGLGTNDVFTIDTAGNIGIGTTAPTSKVSVAGDIEIEAQPDTSAANIDLWSKVSGTTGTIGGNTTTNIASVSASVVYNGSLYVGTEKSNSAEVYRYNGSTGSWTLVSYTAGQITQSGTSNIDRIASMVVYNGQLYIGTYEVNSAEIYRFETSGVWTKVSQSTAGTIRASGTANINGVTAMVVYGGFLFAGTQEETKAEIYRYNGTSGSWNVVNSTAGTFVTTNSVAVDGVSSMAVYNNALYVGTLKLNAADLLRWNGLVGVASGFTKMNNNTSGTFAIDGSSTTAFAEVTALTVFNGKLYIGMRKVNAAEVLVMANADTMVTVNQYNRINSAAGTIMSGGTSSIDRVTALAVYNNRLYVGTGESNAAEIYALEDGLQWRKVSQTVAGRIEEGASTTGSIDAVSVLRGYNGKLYAGTQETNAAEVYEYEYISNSSYALKFQADNGFGGGAQNGLQNMGEMYFTSSPSASLSSNGLVGSFIFSHGIQTAYGAYDVAEDYPTRDQSIQPGDLVSIDEHEVGLVQRSNHAYDHRLVGVYSESPGLRLSQKDATIDGIPAIPVALVGRVPVRVSTESGVIQAGDSLTSSSVPGVAMKATRSGMVVGRAMEGYSGEGVGKILVFVNISSYVGDAVVIYQGLNQTDSASHSAYIHSLTVDTIKANHIEGLEVLVGRLGQLEFTDTSVDFSVLDQTTATVSGLLGDIRTLSERVSVLEKRQNSSSESAQYSSNILNSFEQTGIGSDWIASSESGLTFFGKTSVYDLNILGVLKTGLLTVESDETAAGSIQTSVVPLKLQKDSLGNLEIMGSKVVIDTMGNMVVKESLTVKELKANKIKLIGEKEATPGAVLAASTGKTEIVAGQTSVQIKTSLLTTDSLIFVTPENIPTPVAARKVDDQTIEISIETSLSESLKVNWWVIN